RRRAWSASAPSSTRASSTSMSARPTIPPTIGTPSTPSPAPASSSTPTISTSSPPRSSSAGRPPTPQRWCPTTPRQLYHLAPKEFVRVPPDHAAEMVAYDTLVGEFRVHYAGFFDPGFGWNEAGEPGSKAVPEGRSPEGPLVPEPQQILR